MLLAGLPADCAVGRSVAGDRAGWGHTEELLAVVAEQVATGNWLFVEAHKRKNARNERPRPIPRPGQDPPVAAHQPAHQPAAQPRRRHASLGEMKRMLGRG